MRVAGTYRIAAPPVRVSAALADRSILQKCIPGCERLVETSPGRYEAELRLGVGPFKGSYRGSAEVTGLREGEALALRVDGKGTAGFVRGEADLRFTASDGGTDVACEARAQIGGVVAALGSRLAEAAAKQVMDEFFRSLAEELASAKD